jgi:outer membrane protein OmpA-like peptidoglycan-associated protein
MPQSPASFSTGHREALTAAGFDPVDDNFEMGLASKVLFEFDSSKLNQASIDRLRRVARVLLDLGIEGATIEGHADAVGDEAYNDELSRQRAESVRQVFLAEGMNETRLIGKAMGETEPVYDNQTDEGRAENRRVVIVISSEDIS